MWRLRIISTSILIISHEQHPFSKDTQIIFLTIWTNVILLHCPTEIHRRKESDDEQTRESSCNDRCTHLAFAPSTRTNGIENGTQQKTTDLLKFRTADQLPNINDKTDWNIDTSSSIDRFTRYQCNDACIWLLPILEGLQHCIANQDYYNYLWNLTFQLRVLPNESYTPNLQKNRLAWKTNWTVKRLVNSVAEMKSLDYSSLTHPFSIFFRSSGTILLVSFTFSHMLPLIIPIHPIALYGIVLHVILIGWYFMSVE